MPFVATKILILCSYSQIQQALCLRLLLVWKGSGWRLSELGATGSGAVGGVGGSGEGGKAAR